MSKNSGSTFKICFENQIHKVLKLPNDYDSLKETVSSFYESQLPEKWVLQYTDLEGDKIIVSNEQDYSAFLEDEFSSSASATKIHVVPLDEIQKGREPLNERSQANVSQKVEETEKTHKRSVVSPTSGKLKEKQRRLALKLIENLKRHDISKAKREKMENLLKELNVRLPSPRKDKSENETESTDYVIIDPDQGASHAELSQQGDLNQPSTQSNISFNKKKEGNMKKSSKKKVKTYTLNNINLGEYEIEEEEEEEEEEEQDYEEKDLKKVILQPDEKARKLKEIFSEANLETLLAFTNEFPYLELDELVENYIRF